MTVFYFLSKEEMIYEKVVYCFGVLLIMIFTSISIWGSNFIVKDEMKMDPNVKRVVTVGYSEKDKKKKYLETLVMKKLIKFYKKKLKN